jgi:gliding motility-associated-like protein
MLSSIFHAFCLVFCLAMSAQAQENLIWNGDFEDTSACNAGANAYGAVQYWFIPQHEPVDFAKPCAYIDWWRFAKDKKIGRKDQKRCGYIETYYKGFADDFIYSGRRYLAIPLKNTLKPTQSYYFEMYIRAIDTFPNLKLVNTVFTDGQDVAFVKDFPVFDFDKPRNALGFRPNLQSRLYKDYEWHKISGCFKAVGNEKYLIIGNFRNDAGTEAISTGKKNPNFPAGLIAEYAIDDVFLTEMNLNLRDTAICQGETLTLNVLKKNPETLTYRWHDGSTKPIYQTNQSEKINIELEYTTGCKVEKSILFTVLPPNYQPITQDTVVCIKENVIFKAGKGAKDEKIRWQNGTTNREFSPTNEGIFTAQVTNTCAKWTDTFTLKKRDCGNGIYIPNIFSPNEDGENDDFKPFFKINALEIDSYHFKIFNRWGNLVFQTQDIAAAWNGKMHGKLLSNDTFVWLIEINHHTIGKPEQLILSGEVTLMR